MGMYDKFVGGLENAGRVASGAVAAPVSGLYGAYKALRGGANAGAQGVQDAQEALTYQPRTQEGRSQQQSMSNFMAPVAQTLESTRNTLAETGNRMAGPAGAAALSTLPEIGMMGMGRVVGGVTQGLKQGNLNLPGPTNRQSGYITLYDRDFTGKPTGVGKTLPNEMGVPRSGAATAEMIPEGGTSVGGFIDNLNGGKSQFTREVAGGQTYGSNGAIGKMGLYRAGGNNTPIPQGMERSSYYHEKGNVYANPDVIDAIPPNMRKQIVQRDFNDSAQGAYNHHVGVKPDNPLAQAAAMLNRKRDDAYLRNGTATIGIRG